MLVSGSQDTYSNALFKSAQTKFRWCIRIVIIANSPQTVHFFKFNCEILYYLSALIRYLKFRQKINLVCFKSFDRIIS